MRRVWIEESPRVKLGGEMGGGERGFIGNLKCDGGGSSAKGRNRRGEGREGSELVGHRMKRWENCGVR